MFSQRVHWGLSPHLLAWFCDYWDNNMVAAICVCVLVLFMFSLRRSPHKGTTETKRTLWCLPDRNQIPWILLLTAHSATALAVFLVPPALGNTAATGSPQGGAFVCVCVCVCVCGHEQLKPNIAAHWKSIFHREPSCENKSAVEAA